MGLYRVCVGLGWLIGFSITYWPKALVLVALPFLWVEIRLGQDAKGFRVYWPWKEE